MPVKLLVTIIVAVILTGCSTPALKIDPAVLHSDYDYTKPAEIADKSKPVWVLPVINKGWVPAKIDPQSGDWISGHYTASVIQDGHWATLEEAELAGAPYVVAGDSKPVVPVPQGHEDQTKEVPSSRAEGAEIDLEALEHRISALEAKKDSPPPASFDKEGLSTTMQALAENADAPSAVLVPPSDSRNYQTELRVSQQPHMQAGEGVNDPAPTAGTSVILPGSSLSGDYEIPLKTDRSSTGSSIDVHYLPGNLVEIVYQGKSYRVRVQSPEDQIKITVPGSLARN